MATVLEQEWRMRGLFPSEPGDAAHGVVPRGRKVIIKTMKFALAFRSCFF